MSRPVKCRRVECPVCKSGEISALEPIAKCCRKEGHVRRCWRKSRRANSGGGKSRISKLLGVGISSDLDWRPWASEDKVEKARVTG
jgi:hypothetical protein